MNSNTAYAGGNRYAALYDSLPGAGPLKREEGRCQHIGSSSDRIRLHHASENHSARTSSQYLREIARPANPTGEQATFYTLVRRASQIVPLVRATTHSTPTGIEELRGEPF